MPFIASSDGETVSPVEVSSDADLTCPACSGTMYVRRSYYRGGENSVFVARHFVHSQGSGGDTPGESCPGLGIGESQLHRRMKSITLSKLRMEYPDHVTADVEVPIGDRRADVALSFPPDDPHPVYGEGIAVEIQHRNESKDEDAVTADYLQSGYSVAWLTPDDFDGMDVSISTMLRPPVLSDLSLPLLYLDDAEELYPYQVPPEKGDAEMEIKMPSSYVESIKANLRDAWLNGHDHYEKKIQQSFVRPDDSSQATFDTLSDSS